jgi:hypothetical protein
LGLRRGLPGRVPVIPEHIQPYHQGALYGIFFTVALRTRRKAQGAGTGKGEAMTEQSSRIRPDVRENSHPIVLPVGGTIAVATGTVDIVRPGDALGFFMPSHWQLNSARFEVAPCLMAYCALQNIEFFPSIISFLEYGKLHVCKRSSIPFSSNILCRTRTWGNPGMGSVAKGDQPLEVLRTSHSFAPCLACAVHHRSERQSPGESSYQGLRLSDLLEGEIVSYR